MLEFWKVENLAPLRVLRLSPLDVLWISIATIFRSVGRGLVSFAGSDCMCVLHRLSACIHWRSVR